MALIECSECDERISDQAPACPKCGAPRAVQARPTTIEQTGRTYKLQQVLAVVLIAMGAILGVAAANHPDNSAGIAVAALLVFGGAIWYFVARGMAWWHHG